MKLLNSLQANIGVGLDAFKALRVDYGALGGNDVPLGAGSRNWWAGITPGSDLDYASLVGDPWHNSAVQSVLNWIIRAWPESVPCVKELQGQDKVIIPHELTTVLLNPNDEYDDTVLWAGTILSLWSFGSAYWRIKRDRMGRPKEFHYLPHKWVYPERGTARAIAAFRYVPNNGQPGATFLPEEIIHFRFGINPDDPRFGMGVWDSCLRDIYTDNEASNYSAVMLKNGGALSWLLSQEDPETTISDEQAQRAVDLLKSHSTRDKRGGIAYLDGSIKAQQVSSDPDKMALDAIRRIPETRITGCAGIPAIVCGLASGLERSTFSNSEQAQTAAWLTIMAAQRMISRQLTKQGLHRNYQGTEERQLTAGFDYSEVRALQPDKVAEWKRVGDASDRNLLTLDEARADMGLPLTKDLTPEQQAELKERNKPQEPKPVDPNSKPPNKDKN